MSAKETIYLDYNSTTPIDSRVLQAMMPYLTNEFGNASSSTHRLGWVAKNAVDDAKKTIANAIGADESELVFTSGATDAINKAIVGVFELFSGYKNHFITCETEHKSVLKAHQYLEKRGAQITYLKVDRSGFIDLEELKNSISENTAMVSVMMANNETGVIQDIRKIAEIVHNSSSLLFCDAVQAVGKMKVNVDELGIDVMVVSGHKIYGPKGVGVLYTRRKNPRVKLPSVLHEGTSNVPTIVGMAKAFQLLDIEKEAAHQFYLKEELLKGLQALGAVNNIPHSTTLCNTLNIRFPGVKASELISKCSELAFSLGSACNSSNNEPSHVLKAMGLSDSEIKESFRLSLGRNTNKLEIDNIVEIFHKLNR